MPFPQHHELRVFLLPSWTIEKHYKKRRPTTHPKWDQIRLKATRLECVTLFISTHQWIKVKSRFTLAFKWTRVVVLHVFFELSFALQAFIATMESIKDYFNVGPFVSRKLKEKPQRKDFLHFNYVNAFEAKQLSPILNKIGLESWIWAAYWRNHWVELNSSTKPLNALVRFSLFAISGEETTLESGWKELEKVLNIHLPNI